MKLKEKRGARTAIARARNRVGLKMHAHVRTAFGKALAGRKNKRHAPPALVVNKNQGRSARGRGALRSTSIAARAVSSVIGMHMGTVVAVLP